MSYKNFIAFVETSSENYGILCHFGGYDKGFYGILMIGILILQLFHCIFGWRKVNLSHNLISESSERYIIWLHIDWKELFNLW